MGEVEEFGGPLCEKISADFFLYCLDFAGVRTEYRFDIVTLCSGISN